LGPDRNAFNYFCEWAKIAKLFSLNPLSRQ